MPNNIFTINWTTSDNTTISGVSLNYKPQTTNTWYLVSLPNTATTYTFQDDVLDYNIPYVFMVSPVCLPGYTGGNNSSLSGNIKWKCPTVINQDYGLVVTDNQASLWIDYPALYNCSQVYIDLMDAAGTSSVYPTVIANVVSGEPVSYIFNNINDGVSYNIKITLVSIGTYTHVCPLIPFTTLDTTTSKKYWILSGGHTQAEACSVKNQFIAETQPSYMGNPVVYNDLINSAAAISLYGYGNYGIAFLGPDHPTMSPQTSLGYIREISKDRVFEFNYIGNPPYGPATFGAFDSVC